MATAINILHLTDLHLLDPVSANQEILLAALKDDLRRLRGTDLGPDMAVFTGDLSGHAERRQFERALDLLLELADCVGLDERKVVLCPGNHDAHRAEVEPRWSELVGFRQACRTRDGANELFGGSDFSHYIGSVFSNFRVLGDQFAHDAITYRDHICTTYFLRNVAVVAVNSASLSGTGLNDDDDRGKLAIPEVSLVRALAAAPAGVPVAVVCHHPPEWLNDEHSMLVRRILGSSQSTLLMCGHLHQAMPTATITPNGSVFVAQSGALYEHREYWNGYGVVSSAADQPYYRATFRRWFEPRRSFSHAEDLSDGGVFFSSEESRRFWIATPKVLNCTNLEDWRLHQLLPAVEAECATSLSTQTLEEVFVMPEFERDIPLRRETDEKIGSKLDTVTFDFVVGDSQNYVISAAKESGKSTLLKLCALHIARRSTAETDWSAPVLLTYASFRGNPNKAKNAIAQKLPAMPFGFTSQAMLEQGKLTLLIDEVDFRVARARDNLIKFIGQYPKCRYVIATATPFVESSTLLPEISPDVPFIVVRLRAFRQSQLLTLIENHGVRDPLRADQLLQRVVRDASALNLPLTAVTSTFLIQILNENPEELPVHQAALIERYLELLLQKFAPRELLPATFNFRNKVDLLSVIALRMTHADDYEPEENDVVTWIVEYLHGYGLKYSASDLFAYFVNARVLERNAGRVRFRLRMFYEFFAATRIREDEDFRRFVFSNENYLSFGNEVSFYAALSLRDGEHLQQVFDAFVALDDEYAGRFTEPVRTGKYLEEFVEPNAEITDEELADIEKQVRTEAERKANRRELLDGADVVDSSDQTVNRPQIRTLEERWLAHLIIVSAMLKHTELIPDAMKRAYLQRILDGWIRFAASSLGIVGKLAKDRKVVLNGVTYRLNLADDLPTGELARRLSLNMPVAVAKLASIFVGTEKLQLQLEDGIGAADEDVTRQVFRFCVLSDLMVNNLPDLGIELSARIRDHRFLRHILARKLYDIAVRYRLPDDQLTRIRSLVGDIFIALNNVPTTKIAAKKNALIENMNRQRLLIDFKGENKP